MNLDSYIGMCAFEYVASSFRHCVYILLEIILHQLVQIGFLDRYPGNDLGQAEPAIRVYFGVRQQFEL